jgi:pimeloyl-ACP methyl ester carboxylesterase
VTAFRILRWGDESLPAVVCLHDLGGHARRFERLARMLESGRHVVAYDLRGHGRSPWSGPHTWEQHLEDLDDVLAALNIDQTGVIGDGLGGRLAIAYAADRQERISSLTLLDPPLRPPAPGGPVHRTALNEDPGYPSVDAAIQELGDRLALRHTPRALLEEEMAEHLIADEEGRFHHRYSKAAADADLQLLEDADIPLEEVLCPTLIVHGRESSWVSEGDIEAAEEAIRRCRVETVPGSHAVLWDALAETSAHVRSFLVARKIA